MSPPCDSFGGLAGRPSQNGHIVGFMRGEFGKDRYGLRELKPKDKERVRLATFLTLRCAAVAAACCQHRIPWWAEQPKKFVGCAHAFELDEWLLVRSVAGVTLTCVPQCHFVDLFEKPHDFLRYTVRT